MKKKKIVIFGDSAFAEVAYEMFTHDSDYEVAGFTVSAEFLKKSELFGLPIVPFEDIETRFPSSDFDMYIALVYNNLNRVRRKFYFAAKSKGYRLATYISSRAFVWKNVRVGDNCFIFENNVLQPFADIGSNVVLWSGNHIGHHSTVRDHSFVSSHVVVSGFVDVGECCFLGVNSSINNNVSIGNDCLIGSGSLVVKDIPSGSFVKGPATFPEQESTWQKFGISRDE